eukprot:Clim_evm15s23 gene=Clim_evmTU15s23
MEYVNYVAYAVALLPVGMLVMAGAQEVINVTFYSPGVKKTFNSKNVVITGGSQGLGLALAKLVRKNGGNVTIIARDEKKLQVAKKEIEKVSSPASDATVSYIPSDVTDRSRIGKAIEDIANDQGGIDVLVCAAGMALPQLIGVMPEDSCQKHVNLNYLGFVNTAISALELGGMKETGKGIIVGVGSTCSVMGFAGYTQYCGSKYAIKGFCDAVRNEVAATNIKIKLFLPGTMLTPGYEEEEKLKPEITKKIEGTTHNATAEEAADSLASLIAGPAYLGSNDFETNLLLPITSGLVPRRNVFLDAFIAPIMTLLTPVVRAEHDGYVKKWVKENKKLN